MIEFQIDKNKCSSVILGIWFSFSSLKRYGLLYVLIEILKSDDAARNRRATASLS